ncbi:MAG: hypothetical protein LUD00_11140 [Prevotellaceae bacterium]|nr:hypothetical protein [Prevotellaceae bacterium]
MLYLMGDSTDSSYSTDTQYGNFCGCIHRLLRRKLPKCPNLGEKPIFLTLKRL